MRIRYNAPVVLTLTLLAAAVLVIDALSGGGVIPRYFVTYAGFRRPGDSAALSALRLFTYVLGHQGWVHLMANFSFILLIGPLVEEKYRSGPLLVMMLVTALVTSVLNALFFRTGLMGASGIVFMLILLSSFSNIRSGEIPLTFVLVVVLFLAKEVLAAFGQDNISQFAHVIGGVCGSLFGFVFTRGGRRRAAQ
ncbi:MAG: rhomboid family intramembrane serine protease [Spirochaetales bacterium]|nr:rhomboid family intramembrane serine protease [Spirochaetales bacterium]